MKTKYPKAVWVGFNVLGEPQIAAETRKGLCHYSLCRRYHLHPGNEPTRAQIVKDLNYLYECPSPMGAALVAKRFGVGFKGMRFV